MEYVVVYSQSKVANSATQQLAARVNAMLQDGFKPQGGVAFDAEGRMYQALVRTTSRTDAVKVWNPKDFAPPPPNILEDYKRLYPNELARAREIFISSGGSHQHVYAYLKSQICGDAVINTIFNYFLGENKDESV